MNTDEIEKALNGHPNVTPTPDFSRRVMRAVALQAQEREGIPFPWMRLAVGLGLCTLAVIVAMVAGPPTIDPRVVASALENSVANQAMVWMASTLLGSYVLVRFSLRMAGYRS